MAHSEQPVRVSNGHGTHVRPHLRLTFRVEALTHRKDGAVKIPKVNLVIGPTACGKSAAVLAMARKMGAEILSVDSMKIYRGLEIGVAKPNKKDRLDIPHHLVDFKEFWESCTVADWLKAAEAVIRRCSKEGTPLIAEGGTSMYIKILREGLLAGPGKDNDLRAALEKEVEEKGFTALLARLQEIDPAAAERIFPNDTRRIIRALEVYELTGKTISEQQVQWGRLRKDISIPTVCLHMDRTLLYERIDQRIDRMLELGWLDECRNLLAADKPPSREASQALGYRTLFAHLRGEISYADARDRICFDTHHFARRQISWFRKFKEVAVIETDGAESPEALAERIMEAFDKQKH